MLVERGTGSASVHQGRGSDAIGPWTNACFEKRASVDERQSGSVPALREADGLEDVNGAAGFDAEPLD